MQATRRITATFLAFVLTLVLLPTTAHAAGFAVTFGVEYGINGHGTLSVTVDGSGITTGDTVEEGKDIVFTASPDPGYRVKEWRLDGSPVSGNTSNSYTLQNLSAAALVTVHFEIPTHAVTFSVTGGNGGLTATVDSGSISSPASVQEGKDTVFTASPNTGYRVKEWTLNGSPVSGNTYNSYTLQNLSAAATVTVEFEAIPQAPSVNPTSLTIPAGESRNFTVHLGQGADEATSATVTSNDTSIAIVSPSSVTTSGSAITVTGVSQGNTTISLVWSGGSKDGQSDTVNVRVTDSTPQTIYHTVTFVLAGGTRTGGGEFGAVRPRWRRGGSAHGVTQRIHLRRLGSILFQRDGGYDRYGAMDR